MISQETSDNAHKFGKLLHDALENAGYPQARNNAFNPANTRDVEFCFNGYRLGRPEMLAVDIWSFHTIPEDKFPIWANQIVDMVTFHKNYDSWKSTHHDAILHALNKRAEDLGSDVRLKKLDIYSDFPSHLYNLPSLSRRYVHYTLTMNVLTDAGQDREIQLRCTDAVNKNLNDQHSVVRAFMKEVRRSNTIKEATNIAPEEWPVDYVYARYVALDETQDPTKLLTDILANNGHAVVHSGPHPHSGFVRKGVIAGRFKFGGCSYEFGTLRIPHVPSTARSAMEGRPVNDFIDTGSDIFDGATIAKVMTSKNGTTLRLDVPMKPFREAFAA